MRALEFYKERKMSEQEPNALTDLQSPKHNVERRKNDVCSM